MKRSAVTFACAFAIAAAPIASSMEGAEGKESDRFVTDGGTLEIVFLGHASLALEYRGMRVYIDPVARYGDYGRMPKADLILITHEHGDHMEKASIEALTKAGTRLIGPEAVRSKLGAGTALEHGKGVEAAGIAVEAVPAYNTTGDRLKFHPKERKDNGYILTVGGLRIYIAGDTEPIPEMAGFGKIDIAFLPMNQPYTMTVEQAAAAARTIKPRILYPYHFGTTDTAELLRQLEGERGIETRMRKLE